MASYEVEHGISGESESKRSNPRRPDMSTFFSRLSEIRTDDEPSRQHNNPHATPTPVDVASTYNLYADALRQVQTEALSSTQSELIERMIGELLQGAEDPPAQVKGVSQEYLDGLDRVSRKALRSSDECPICSEKFLDDKYCLVVQLPCHPKHRFDLDCIAPWLKLQGTCPLDRKDLTKKKQAVIPDDDEEEDYDDMIA